MLFFLVRLLPHAHVHCAYQSGHFDVTDRLFASVEETWRMNLTGISEVKELLPEFYDCPEFLRNANGFDLGRTQDGSVVGDVALPAWVRICVELRVLWRRCGCRVGAACAVRGCGENE